MKNSELRVIHIDDIPQGGFAGIVEKRILISPKLMPDVASRKDISHGLGDLVYIATGHFKANDGAPLHPHENIDIVTIVLSGRLVHAGTKGDGLVIDAPGVQVQRAGTGMLHSEVNPENSPADFVQIWFLPPKQGLTPGHQNIDLIEGELTTVLGGDCAECFDNKMTCKVGSMAENEILECEKNFVALITEGSAIANGHHLLKGDLFEGNSLQLKASSKLGLVLIY